MKDWSWSNFLRRPTGENVGQSESLHAGGWRRGSNSPERSVHRRDADSLTAVERQVLPDDLAHLLGRLRAAQLAVDDEVVAQFTPC